MNYRFQCFIYRDGDSVLDSVDNCIEASNGDQADTDGDGIGLYIVDIVFSINSPDKTNGI
jgi:hypothetical protein